MPHAMFEVHFSAGQLARLGRLCTLVEPLPATGLEATGGLSKIEILLTGWGTEPLGPDVAERMPALRLVAHMAGTVKPIVPPELLGRGVKIVHAAAANARPVAEYALAVILLANKGVLHWQRAYRRERERFSRWCDPRAREVGNLGRTVGIVGASRVGRLLLGLLRHHELEVLLADPYVDRAEAAALGAELVSLRALLERSDVVSLHQPLLPETVGAIGRAELAAMRDGALLINTARGGVVDHAALTEALATGRISAVLDVTEPEPLPATSPLWSMPNVVLTPHIAGSMGNEVERMTVMMLDEVERFLAGAALRHEVTIEEWGRVA